MIKKDNKKMRLSTFKESLRKQKSPKFRDYKKNL